MKLNNRDSASAAFLQKYLAVIDLTSSKSVEVDDQVMMLVALVERFKGMAQAFTSCGTVDIGDAQADALSVVDLYMWYDIVPNDLAER
jgi:mediator of RNA polymerase II transcription subunit 12